MKRWRQWVEFLSTTENGTAMAGFRIGIGLALLYTFALPWWHGVADIIWVDSDFGGLRDYSSLPWLIEALGGASPKVIYGVLSAGIFSSLSLVLGILPQSFALIGMIALKTIGWHNLHATGGHDDLIANALWILCFTDSAATLSVQAKYSTGNWTSKREIASWPRYLVLFQLVLMYWSTGWQKLSSHWIPFGEMDALWYILQQPSWARYDMQWLAPFSWLTKIGTFSVWMWEFFAPLIFLVLYYENTPSKEGWLRQFFLRYPLRRFYCFFGISMHILIMLLMVIGPFSLASIAYYSAFYSDQKK